MTYKIWDKKENVILPDGNVYTPEELMEVNPFGFTKYAVTVLGMHGNITYEVQNLDILKSMYNIAEDNDEAALAAFIQAKETEILAEAAEPEPSAEERIAAALEYQNLISM